MWRIKFLNCVSSFSGWLAEKLEFISETCKRCPHCGENPYKAPPCLGCRYHKK
jgi:hypothetical protein